MMSPGAVAEMEASFDDIARDLRTEVGERLDGREALRRGVTPRLGHGQAILSRGQGGQMRPAGAGASRVV
jgi:hypothetical protein